MAAQPALAQPLLSVVPDVQTQKEIENTIDAPKRISDVIEDLEKKQTDAQAELAQALGRDFGVAPLNIDSAVEKQKTWKAKNDALAARIQACKQLRDITTNRIDDLKTTHPDAIVALLQRKMNDLEKESAAEKSKGALLKDQIDSLRALLHELERSASTTAAKSKKISLEDVQLRAYFIFENRRRAALPGDETQDWIEAKRQFCSEAETKVYPRR